MLLEKYGGKSSNYQDLFKRESLKLANVNGISKKQVKW